MVGETGETMKRYTFTSSDNEVVKTYDGDYILFHKNVVTNWVKSTYNKNKLELSEEDKIELYKMQTEYADVFREIWNHALYDISGLNWVLPDRIKSPVEEYEQFLTIPKDEDYTDEEYEIKLQGLREIAEWYKKQQNN